MQMLSVSRPSGKRPALRLAVLAAAAAGRSHPGPGTTTMQPPLPWSASSVASSGLAMVPLALELLCWDRR